MSIDKTGLKMAVLETEGIKADDRLEATKMEISSHQGGVHYLKQGRKAVESLVSHVQKDIDEGKFGKIDGPLAIGEVIMKYLSRAEEMLNNIAISAEVASHISRGKAQAHEENAKRLKKEYDILAEKKLAMSDPDQDPSIRVVGTHPGDPLADRKEEKKERKTKK